MTSSQTRSRRDHTRYMYMYISGPSVSLNIRMLQAFEFLLKLLGSHSDYMHTVHTLYKVAIGLAQGGDTPIDAVVTAATALIGES